MSMGIYKIENMTNGKIYIGSSKNIENRWSQHRSLLKSGKHHSQHLQHAWDRYNESNFKFNIVEDVIMQEDLFTREQYWMDTLQCYNPKNGYNISLLANACLMNDNYDFKEIIQEENELENKYKIMYMIINKQNEELIYRGVQDRDPVEHMFNDFIYYLYRYFESIDFESFDEITLYTDKANLTMKDFQGINIDICKDSIYKLNFKKVIIENDHGGQREVFYKSNFEFYEIKESKDGYMAIRVYDGFDVINYILE